MSILGNILWIAQAQSYVTLRSVSLERSSPLVVRSAVTHTNKHTGRSVSTFLYITNEERLQD